MVILSRYDDRENLSMKISVETLSKLVKYSSKGSEPQHTTTEATTIDC